MSAFALLAGAALLADYHGTLTLSDAQLVQARGVTGDTAGLPQVVTGPAADLINKPNVGLEVTSGHWDTTLAYFPIFTLQDLEDGVDFTQDHLGAAGVFWHDLRLRLGVLEEGGYGQVNFTTVPPVLPGTVVPPLQLITPGETLTLLTASTRTRLRSTFVATRRLTVTLGVGYQAAGGANAVSRQTLPFEKGPIAEALLEYRATRDDRLLTTVNALESDYSTVACLLPAGAAPATLPSCTPQTGMATAIEEWRRRLTRQTEVFVNGGGAFVRSRQAPTDSYDYALYPQAAAGVLAHLPREDGVTTLRASGVLAPIIAQQTGVVEQRINGDASVEWKQHRTTLTALGRVAQTIPTTDPGAAVYLRAEVDAAYEASKRVKLTFGVRTDWERVEVGIAGVPSGTETLSTLAFLQAAVSAAPIHF